MNIEYKDTHDFSCEELEDLFCRWTGPQDIILINWLLR